MCVACVCVCVTAQTSAGPSLLLLCYFPPVFTLPQYVHTFTEVETFLTAVGAPLPEFAQPWAILFTFWCAVKF